MFRATGKGPERRPAYECFRPCRPDPIRCSCYCFVIDLLIANQNEERENKQGDTETHKDSPYQLIGMVAARNVTARSPMQGLRVLTLSQAPGWDV